MMGAQLDLDDVVHGHPLATIELANLRARIVALEEVLKKARTMLDWDLEFGHGDEDREAEYLALLGRIDGMFPK